jgi:hypothetical protein
MNCSISRSELVREMREYSQELALVAAVKSAPIAASEAREELPFVLAFLAHLTATQSPRSAATKKVSSKPRCAHYASIRRAFACAREAGLDTKADAAMRAAFSRFLGRTIESREEMNGSDWESAATAVKCGELTW